MGKKMLLTKPILITSDSDVSQRVDVVLHLNIFLPNDNDKSYIEIGILVSRKEFNNFERNFNIQIKFPFEISRCNFQNMKEKLCDSGILNMIFNEETFLDREKLVFRLKEYKLGNIKLCDTTMNNDSSITMSVAEKQKNSYFRFRIDNIEKNISEVILSDEKANPFKKSAKIIGLCINESREYPQKFDRILKFNEINTFVILNSSTELIESSKQVKSFRVLEDDLWKQYIGFDIDSIMIVYQFKNKAPENLQIEGDKLFLKSLHHKKSIWRFFVIMAAIAVISNFIYDFIKHIINFEQLMLYLDNNYKTSNIVDIKNEYVAYHYIKNAKIYYPNFDIWYFANVIPSLKAGKKKLIYMGNYNCLRGIAILKYNEKKLCHLSVMDAYKNKGYGIKLFKKSFEELKTEKPFLTVSEEKLPDFKRVFDYFGFKLTNVIEGYYRDNKKEYFYNQL